MSTKRRLQYRWERIRDIVNAWAEDGCAICGNAQPYPTVDDEGLVWQYCPTCDRTRVLAKEDILGPFAPELQTLSDSDYDLPF